MKEYICTETVDLHTGRVGLTKKQVDRRRHKLKPVKEGDGIYDVVSSVQFKAGESVRIQDPDKATLSRLNPTEPEPAKTEPAKEEKAEQPEFKAKTEPKTKAKAKKVSK